MNRITRVIAALILFVIAATLAAIMTHLLTSPTPEPEPSEIEAAPEQLSCFKIKCQIA